MTASDLWKLGDSSEDFELIEGELVRVSPTSGEHARVQARLIIALSKVVPELTPGEILGEAGYVLQRNPDTVLEPDLSFMAADRIPADITGFFDLAPDLAVEVVSRSNMPGEIERKLAIYLKAGVRCVWIVYPRERQVVVHVPVEAPRTYREGDVLPGEPVLPGFSVPVGSIFA
jgi:Uma2 family endonuclease